MQATGALLQVRNKRHEKLLHQFSEYGTAAVTPGAADSCGKSIKATACVTFRAEQDANAAAISVKTALPVDDQRWTQEEHLEVKVQELGLW